MAFSVTVTSSLIAVTSGTGTLAELYADAIAASAGCMTTYSTSSSSSAGTSVNIYQIVGNRELELRSGVTLTTDDGDTLQWTLTANKYPILDAQLGSVLNLSQNTTIIGDTNGVYQTYAYFQGETNVNGTSGNEVIFEKFRSLYIYGYRNQDWDHVIIRDCMLSSGYNLYFRPTLYDSNDSYTHTFDDITCLGGPTETSTNGYVYFDTGDYTSFTFNNLNMTNGGYALFYQCSNLVINGGTLLNTNIDNRYYACGSEGLASWHYAPVNSIVRGATWQNQPKVKYKNYTFDDGDAGNYVGGVTYTGTVIYFEDCTFQNGNYGVYANFGTVIWLGTNTFNSITTADRRWNNGQHLYGRRMTLNVSDSGATGIADATVTMRQKQGREHWSFRTDANGDVLDPRGDPIVLIEKEETSTGVFTQWSDGTGDQVHVIEVYKEGYTPHTEEIAMTSDKTVNITLQTRDASATVLNGTTLYNATIY